MIRVLVGQNCEDLKVWMDSLIIKTDSICMHVMSITFIYLNNKWTNSTVLCVNFDVLSLLISNINKRFWTTLKTSRKSDQVYAIHILSFYNSAVI